jgi:hypothetical protein
MKLFNVLVLCSILALAGAASAQNMLVNGDFETGDLTGWSVSGLSPNSVVTVQSPDNGPTLPGTNNAYMDNSAQAIGLNLRQSTADGSVGAGLVTFSFDLKLIEANAGGVVFAEVIAEMAGGGILASSGLVGPLWPWNDWSTFGGSFEAPAGTDFLTIRIEAATGAAVDANCLLHVDNVVLESENAVAVDAATWSGVKALYR